ncbi:hypothetical protein [Emticicia sp.]|uniref:hypothetical protein n=1 Tax=Emticicia sp. TaxID=1930953 RepID=UPI0037512609
MFAFNPLLNTDYLNEIYGNDLTIVQIIFESFLDDNIPIWEEILGKINSKNYKQVSDMTHQIKPSFSMVGLTYLHPKIQEFEIFTKENPDENELLVKYNNLTVEINQAKTIIKDELNRLNQLI